MQPRMLSATVELAERRCGSIAMDAIQRAEEVLGQAQDPPFTGPPYMFTCTYSATLEGQSVGHAELIANLSSRTLKGAVKVINSNFGSVCQPGYTHLMKEIKAEPATLAPIGRRKRRPEGSGRCFNSALEPILEPKPQSPVWQRLQELASSRVSDKHYKLKNFPRTGATQVCGVLLEDMADGRWAVEEWVRFLNESPLPEDAKGNVQPRARVTITDQHPTMINYKFVLTRTCDRIVYNLIALQQVFEEMRDAQGPVPNDGEKKTPDGFFRISHIKAPVDSAQISICLEKPNGRINIFQKGKVNVLGAPSTVVGHRIFDFLSGLLRARWTDLVYLQPLPDNQLVLDAALNAQNREAQARRPSIIKIEPPAEGWAHDKMDELVDYLLDDAHCEPDPQAHLSVDGLAEMAAWFQQLACPEEAS